MATIDSAREHLKALGLTLTATEQDVRRAYRRLVMEWHPDRFSNDPNMKDRAARRMAQLSVAYAALREHFRSRRETPASTPTSTPRPNRRARAPATRAGGPRQRPPSPLRRCPVWLGYACIYVSAIHALCYLAMVVLYAHGSDAGPQASQDVGVLAATIACFCMVWSGYLFYIGVRITLGDGASDKRLLLWCAGQSVAAILLAVACALERYSDGMNPAMAEGRAAAIALQVGIASVAYAVFLFGIRVLQQLRSAGRGAPR